MSDLTAVSRPRAILVVLLVASTALFAVGALVERSQADEHAEAASAQTQQSNQPTAEPAGAHAEGDDAPGAEQEGAGGDEGEAGETHAEESETLLGINVESTPLIVLAVAVGLGLAALAASQVGRLPAVLLAIALIALAWAALDVREVVHQLDESHTGIAILAIAVAVLHVTAAALAGWLSARAPHRATGTTEHPPGTMAT